MIYVDVKSSTYIDSSNDINDHHCKLKNGDTVRMSKYKNIFTKGYNPNWSEEICVIKKVKNTVPWTYVVMILMDKKLLDSFMKKNCKKQIKKRLELKKIIKKKCDKLYDKWKGYNNSFNSWTDKKDIAKMNEFSRTKFFRSKCKS